MSSWWSLLVSDVHCVLQRDPAARNLLEAWTIYPGVHAIAHHRIAHALWTRGWRYLPRWISFVSRCVTQVDIHPGARIGARFFIDHGNGVVVGAGAKILGPIRIGDRARIAANSVVIEHVPAGATVVGIPGRVVAPQRSTTYGFDLDHHLIPDPVGKAIACLLDRMALLERTHLAASETNCATCDDACVEPIFSRPAYPSALQPSHSAHLE